MSTDSSTDDPIGPNEVEIPYKCMNILHPQLKDIYAYDVMRYSQHPPIDAAFSDVKHFHRSILWPYYMSGHDMPLQAIQQKDGCATKRYYCPDTLDSEHGACVASVWDGQCTPRGYVDQRLLCTCCLSTGVPGRPRLFYTAVFGVKHESLNTAIGAIYRSILYITTNPPVKFSMPPRNFQQYPDIRTVLIKYNPLEDYGELQTIGFTVVREDDDGFRVTNPFRSDNSVMSQPCCCCSFANLTTDIKNAYNRLMFQLSCGCAICEVCVPPYFGCNEIPEGYCGPPRTDEIKCPKPQCSAKLEKFLITPFVPPIRLWMPTPVYYWGRKPVYTKVTKDALKPFIDANLLWYFDAVKDTDLHMTLMQEYRFSAHATREYDSDTLSQRPPSTTLARYKLIEEAHTAWHQLQLFLKSKRMFLRWFYEWDHPFPEELLNQDRHYYKNVLERNHYQYLRTEADRLFYQIQILDDSISDQLKSTVASVPLSSVASTSTRGSSNVLCLVDNNVPAGSP